MTSNEITIATDTATLCVFDLDQLKHRLNDDADWWTTPDAELAEMNQGNVAFLGLGSDGAYKIVVEEFLANPAVEVNLKIHSGRVFIGAAEEVTSSGLEPEGLRGFFVTLPPGNYLLGASRKGDDIRLAFTRGGSGTNEFRQPVML